MYNTFKFSVQFVVILLPYYLYVIQYIVLQTYTQSIDLFSQKIDIFDKDVDKASPQCHTHYHTPTRNIISSCLSSI